MTLKHNRAIELLRETHKRINKMIDKYDSKLSASDKERSLAEISYELNSLFTLETEIFYPALNNAVAEGDIEDAIARIDHIKVFIAHAQRMMGDEASFDSRMEDLINAVKRHFKEDERIFRLAERGDLDMDVIADEMETKSRDITAGFARRNA